MDSMRSAELSQLLSHQLAAMQQAMHLHQCIVERLGEGVAASAPCAAQNGVSPGPTQARGGRDLLRQALVEPGHAAAPRQLRASENGLGPGPAQAFGRLDKSIAEVEHLLRQGGARAFAEPGCADSLQEWRALEEPLLRQRGSQEASLADPPSPAGAQWKAPSGAKARLMELHEAVATKKQLKKFLEPQETGESSLYKAGGWATRLARSSPFQNVTLVIVLMNICWIGIDTDFNKASVLCQAPLVFQVVDNLFCTFFVFEVTVRITALGSVCSVLRSGWLLFDFGLAASMVWETWLQVLLFLVLDVAPGGKSSAANSLRVLRLLRVTRLARVLRVFPELMILVKGMAAGVRAIFAVIVLLMLMLYVFGLVFTQLGVFGSVLESVERLLSQVLCGFDEDFLAQMLAKGWVHYFLFLVFMLFASFMLMNMLIGILCQVISDVSDDAEVERTTEELDTKVDDFMDALDVTASGHFTIDDLDCMIQEPEQLVELLKSGIDFETFKHNLRLFVGRERDGISRDDFKQLTMQCAGQRPVTLKDILDNRHIILMEVFRIESVVENLAAAAGVAKA